ncbi:hypothetical protein D3C78_1613030 [compost metagenome]
MIGHNQGVGAAVHGVLSIFDIKNSLEHQRAIPKATHPRDVGPGHGRVELGADPRAHGCLVTHTLCMANDIAAAAAGCTQHFQAPARFASQVGEAHQSALGIGATIAYVLVSLTHHG